MTFYDLAKSIPPNPLRIAKNIFWRFPSTISSLRAIFIIGTPRSGSTLLKSILAGSTDTACVPHETTDIFMYRDTFSYWSNFSQDGQIEEIKKILNSSRDIINFYERIAGPILAANSASVFVDKIYRVDKFLIEMIARHMPNSHFIYISRDGRDCYCSALNHPGIPQRKTLPQFARYYNNNELMRAKIFANFDQMHYNHIKYEDLCQNPSKIIAGICASAGISYNDKMIANTSFSLTSNVSITAIHSNLNNPINSKSVSRFRAEMSPPDIAAFEAYAGRALRELDYLA